MALADPFGELHPALIPYARWCLDVAERYRIPIHVTSVYRSNAQQAKLYANFKAGRSTFPANPPGQSAHNYRLAWDSVPGSSGRSAEVPRELRDWWTYVRELAGWRVPPGDWIHAEYPNWRDVVR